MTAQPIFVATALFISSTIEGHFGGERIRMEFIRPARSDMSEADIYSTCKCPGLPEQVFNPNEWEGKPWPEREAVARNRASYAGQEDSWTKIKIGL